MDRLIKIKEVLKLEHADSFIVINLADIRYFSNLVSSNIGLLITKEKSYVFSDGRYKYLIESQDRFEPVLCTKNIFDCICDKVIELNLSNVLIDPNHISFKQYQLLEKRLGNKISLVEDVTKTLRIIKEEEELKDMIQAQKIAEKAYLEVIKTIRIGNTTKEIAAKLDYLMKLYGSEEPAFDTIVVAGAESANCHGVPSNTPIKDGDFILFDFGATFNGYRSDMTRTVGIGNITEFQKQIYKIVLTAHELAAEVVKPTVACSKVDQIARDYIIEKSFGDLFLHSLGHGVGLDIHEYPTLSSKSEYTLEKGMVITIEPGIYIHHQFGVRIEDTFIVTEKGAHSLANLSKELVILPS